jgi:hypothetical protein
VTLLPYRFLSLADNKFLNMPENVFSGLTALQ